MGWREGLNRLSLVLHYPMANKQLLKLCSEIKPQDVALKESLISKYKDNIRSYANGINEYTSTIENYKQAVEREQIKLENAEADLEIAKNAKVDPAYHMHLFKAASRYYDKIWFDIEGLAIKAVTKEIIMRYKEADYYCGRLVIKVPTAATYNTITVRNLTHDAYYKTGWHHPHVSAVNDHICYGSDDTRDEVQALLRRKSYIELLVWLGEFLNSYNNDGGHNPNFETVESLKPCPEKPPLAKETPHNDEDGEVV